MSESRYMLWYMNTQYLVRESSPWMDSRVASCHPAFKKSKKIVRALKLVSGWDTWYVRQNNTNNIEFVITLKTAIYEPNVLNIIDQLVLEILNIFSIPVTQKIVKEQRTRGQS